MHDNAVLSTAQNSNQDVPDRNAEEASDLTDNEMSIVSPSRRVGGASDATLTTTAGEADLDFATDVRRAEVTYSVLGVDIPIHGDEEEIYQNTGRIQKIENLERCIALKNLSLIGQQITQLDGLEANLNLTHLELYQNKLTKIDNISHLVNLTTLDLSFNEIRTLENIASLNKLQKLFLSSNKLTKIEGLETLTNLRVLELGSNRIRLIENLENLTNLEELWLGKNKISTMTIPPLPNLLRVSLQSNRLVDWDVAFFRNAPNLEELYLSHNALADIPTEITALKRLRTLDLAGNRLKDLNALKGCETLEELWCNDNLIEDVDAITVLKQLPKLETVYLERNPIQRALGPGYRTAIMDLAPGLKQLDAILLRESIKVVVKK